MSLSIKTTGHIAGALYLMTVITGIFHLMYVPGQLIDMDNPQAMLDAILSDTLLFKASIGIGVLSYLFYMSLPLMLYRIAAPQGPTTSLFMVGFALVSIPISFIGMGEKLAILPLLESAQGLSGEARHALAQDLHTQMEAYYRSATLASIFWGLWLFPLGLLALKTRFIPRALGLLLLLGCLGYVANFFGDLLIPGYSGSAIDSWDSKPASLAEIGTCLWLLIMGAKPPHDAQ